MINGFYKNHLTVFAEVVPVALELSSEEIVVEPTLGLPAEAGKSLYDTVYYESAISLRFDSVHVYWRCSSEQINQIGTVARCLLKYPCAGIEI